MASFQCSCELCTGLLLTNSYFLQISIIQSGTESDTVVTNKLLSSINIITAFLFDTEPTITKTYKHMEASIDKQIAKCTEKTDRWEWEQRHKTTVALETDILQSSFM